MSVTVKADRVQFRESLMRELDIAMKLSTSHLEQQVVLKTPVNFGILRKSITSKSTLTRGVVFADQPGARYAEFVEDGRGPGKFPPWGKGSSLELWVRRVLRIASKKLRSVTYAVASGISEKGTKAVKMFERTEKQERNKVLDIYRRAIERLERLVSND